jgi:type IV secretory pathway VirB2 component (pilin)
VPVRHATAVRRLSPEERRTLLGPAVVGVLLGLLAAALGASVRSEYGSRMMPLYPGVHGPVAEALITFALVTLGVVLLFGIAPLLLLRLARSRRRGA